MKQLELNVLNIKIKDAPANQKKIWSFVPLVFEATSAYKDTPYIYLLHFLLAFVEKPLGIHLIYLPW